jgi:anti-sigma B factor antagonist
MGIVIETATFRTRPVLRIAGEIICQESIRISMELETLLHSDHESVFIDLSGTTFIDSYGLGGLIYSLKLLERHGKKLMLLNPHTKVLEVLQRNNMDRLFMIEYSMGDE